MAFLNLLPKLPLSAGVIYASFAKWFVVLHDISVALLFILVPRTGFGGGAGAFGALVMAGSLCRCEPEDANQQG